MRLDDVSVHIRRIEARPSARMALRPYLLGGLLTISAMVSSTPASAQDRTAVPTTAPTIAEVPLLRIDGPIGPATADYIARGLQKAGKSGAPLLVL